MVATLHKIGLTVVANTPEQFSAQIRRAIEINRKRLEQANKTLGEAVETPVTSRLPPFIRRMVFQVPEQRAPQDIPPPLEPSNDTHPTEAVPWLMPDWFTDCYGVAGSHPDLVFELVRAAAKPTTATPEVSESTEASPMSAAPQKLS